MKIGLLNAYAPGAADFQQAYWPMFQRFFSEHVSSDFLLHEYNVTQRYWPNSLNECDGWIIGASQHSVHDKNSWITKLMEFACACYFNQKPLIGIGFGHQVIAHALGGEVNKSRKGWLAGLHDFKVRQQRPWMTPELTNCSLYFSHKYQVDMLPDKATLLAGNSFCLHQMYTIEDHIFALQGHPEYDLSFMQAWLDHSKLTKEQHEQAVASLDQPINSEIVGGWMRQFFTAEQG